MFVFYQIHYIICVACMYVIWMYVYYECMYVCVVYEMTPCSFNREGGNTFGAGHTGVQGD